ncbi:MAG: DUF3576 domain-containing protein [Magnetococcales bacterium]|nr:DUF3576 domain-containing protein [Magnetococcales bacterium]
MVLFSRRSIAVPYTRFYEQAGCRRVLTEDAGYALIDEIRSRGEMKMQRSMPGIVLLSMVVLSGCSEKMWGSRNKVDDYGSVMGSGQSQIEKDGKREGQWGSMRDAGEPGLLSIGGGEGIFGGGSKTSEEDVRAGKLFGGALSVVMDLPVIVASREGGFISTDWKVDPTDPGARYRLNIRVSGVKPYGAVDVRVMKQTLANGMWTDRQADVALSRQIEKAIRKQAEVDVGANTATAR